MTGEDILNESESITELKVIRSELELIRQELQQLNQNMFQFLDLDKEKTPPPVKKSSTSKLTEHSDLKSFMESLRVIKSYEKREKQGITAQELANMRDLSRPTVYNHLEELQRNNLIITRRGNHIGIKPSNSNFYYATERDPSRTLWNFNVLTSLSNSTQQIAQTIIKAEHQGITIPAISQALSMPKNKIEKGIQELLKQFLIDYHVEGVNHRYFAVGKISESHL